MTLKYTIARSELNKKKPKVRSKEATGARDEHRNTEPVIAVLKKMKNTEIFKAG